MVCGVIGHRDYEKEKYSEKLEYCLKTLIDRGSVYKFLIGSRSMFAEEVAKWISTYQTPYCIKLVACLTKTEHRFLKSQKSIADSFADVLCRAGMEHELILYDDIIYSDCNATKSAYIKRDRMIVDKSDILLFYYDHDIAFTDKLLNTNSGSALAYEYAKRSNKIIINIADIVNKKK